MLFKTALLNFVVLSVLLVVALAISGCSGDDPDPPNASEILAEGWTLFQAENYAEAKEKFDVVLADEPNNAEAYVGLGWVHGKTMNIQKAIASFQSALSMEAQNIDALAGIAMAYLAADQYDQAIDSAEKVLNPNPNYAFTNANITSCDIRIVLAESYYFKGELENSQKELAKVDPSVDELDPSDEDYAVKLLQKLESVSGGC